ncbi:MAG: hypothetical protein ACRDOD_19895, partial [Streptosporangiaceae bacterium]
MPDGRHNQAWSGGAGPRICPALQRVLDLQLQLRREVLEIDAGGADEPAISDEAIWIGAAVSLPSVVVARAEDLRRVDDPQIAERQTTFSLCGVARAQVRRVPGGQIRIPSAIPPVTVLGAQTVPGTACIAAAIHRARSQRSAAADRRPGV